MRGPQVQREQLQVGAGILGSKFHSETFSIGRFTDLSAVENRGTDSAVQMLSHICLQSHIKNMEKGREYRYLAGAEQTCQTELLGNN